MQHKSVLNFIFKRLIKKQKNSCHFPSVFHPSESKSPLIKIIITLICWGKVVCSWWSISSHCIKKFPPPSSPNSFFFCKCLLKNRVFDLILEKFSNYARRPGRIPRKILHFPQLKRKVKLGYFWGAVKNLRQGFYSKFVTWVLCKNVRQSTAPDTSYEHNQHSAFQMTEL